MTPEELARLEQLARAATPGPWNTHGMAAHQGEPEA